MTQSIDTWQRVAADAALQAAADAADPHDAAAIAQLRKGWPPALVTAALQLAEARRKAQTKLPPERAATLLADAPAVEQASSLDVAALKARRFATLGRPVVDLCSGAGFDSLALAQAGCDVRAVDLDPARAWMTARNARVPAAAADVKDVQLRKQDAWHLDPSRRTGGRRAWRLSDYQPGPDYLAALIAAHPDGAAKLAPGVDAEELPVPEGLARELQIISRAGQLVQAVLWTGALAGAQARSALRLDAAGVHTLEGDGQALPPLGEVGRFIHTIDPAAERAGLLAELCDQAGCVMPHPALGLLSADAAKNSPWLTPFEVMAELPWREKKVRAFLREQGIGRVEVKTRGGAVDPNLAQKRLRGPGDAAAVVFVLRWDRQVIATIAQRIEKTPTNLSRSPNIESD